MGACFSSKTDVTPKAIRVVHLDGSLEDYDDTTTVEQVINNFPKHFLCTPVQILQDGLVPLKLDQQLNTGQIYFLLPNSTLKFNASPTELTSLTRKLTNIAKTGQSQVKSVPISPSTRSENRFLDHRCGLVEYVGKKLHESPRWKPNLATIRETSFSQRNVCQDG